MKWSFYDLDTGIFTGRYFSGRGPDDLARNTPQGSGAIEGEHDHLSSRIDLDTGAVVAYDAPPDPRRQRDEARARIARLEGQQARPLRELSLDPGNTEARQRLEAIDAEIETLRAEIISTVARPAS